MSRPEPGPWFFGYGSLVNAATHDYPDLTLAELAGWQRIWRDLPGSAFATLSVRRAPEGRIKGALCRVPHGDWRALDLRERHYLRRPVSAAVTPPRSDVAVYEVPIQSLRRTGAPAPILQSYLDVVIQGYAQLYGAAGARAFVATTHSWDRPVHDDRAAPVYPRHQLLSDAERALCDACLADAQARKR